MASPLCQVEKILTRGIHGWRLAIEVFIADECGGMNEQEQ